MINKTHAWEGTYEFETKEGKQYSFKGVIYWDKDWEEFESDGVFYQHDEDGNEVIVPEQMEANDMAEALGIDMAEIFASHAYDAEEARRYNI